MKNHKIITLFIFAFLYFFIVGSNRSLAQGEIVSVNPSSAFTGETTHLIIQGENTNFIKEQTKIWVLKGWNMHCSIPAYQNY